MIHCNEIQLQFFSFFLMLLKRNFAQKIQKNFTSILICFQWSPNYVRIDPYSTIIQHWESDVLTFK